MSGAAATLDRIDYSILQQCMHCGMCLPTCPTYDETHHERNSPRGRIALMRAVADHEIPVTREFADEMSYCLGCLACQTACPAGVQYGVLLETARSTVEESGVSRTHGRTFWRNLALRQLFMSPARLRAAGTALRLYQRTGLEALVRRVGLTRLLPTSLRHLEPQAPTIAPAFSSSLIAPIEAPAQPPRYRVALLTGCVQDLVFPHVNRDTADVLLANGCAVETPRSQPCCGSLHAHNGELDMARELATRMLDLIPPSRFDAIITNAGGCGSHLRHYTGFLGEDPTYGPLAREWDAKVRDIHEWLAEIGCRPPQASPFEEPVQVTYHDSCHLAHGQKVVAQPRALLRLLPGVSMVDLPESSWCCGSAGVYSITQPEQAEKLRDRKIRNVQSTGASIVATGNPGCQLQITSGLRDAGADATVHHPVSLLAAAYRREPAAAADVTA